MTQEEILVKMRDSLVAGLFIKEDTVFELDTQYGRDLGLDSLDKVEIKLTIEDEFDVRFPDDSFGNDVETVADTVKMVAEHL